MLSELSELSEAVETHQPMHHVSQLEAPALQRATELWQEVVTWYEDLSAPTPTMSPIPSLETARLRLAECELASSRRRQ